MIAVIGGVCELSVGRLCAQQILPASIGTAVMNGFFAWAALRGTQQVPLTGAPSILFDLLPATFMSTLMLVLVTTLVARRQNRNAPPPAQSVTSRLPASLALRGLALAALATIIVSPLVAGVLVLASPPLWTWAGFGLFKLGFSVLLTAALLPSIVRAILAHDLRGNRS